MRRRANCPPPAAVIDAVVEQGPQDVREHAYMCERCQAIAGAALLILDDARDAAGAADELTQWLAPEAQQIVHDLLAETPARRWWLLATRNPLMQHAEVAAHLLAIADPLYDQSPMLGLSYVETAVRVCEILAERNELEAWSVFVRALKDSSTFLRRLGKYSDAEEALDRAEKLADRTASPQYEQAVIHLARGLLFSQPDVGRYRDAVRLFQECEPALETAGDSVRSRMARCGLGLATLYDGRARAALQIFDALLKRISDPLERATICQNLATCKVRLGDPGGAILAAMESERLFGASPAPSAIPIVQCRWIVARAHLMTGALSAARQILVEIGREFERLEMWDTFVRVRLDLVRALCGDGAIAEAKEVCETVATLSTLLDRREPTRRRECTAEALAYLRDLARQDTLTSDTVDFVCDYLETITTHPPLRFVPPMNPLLM